MARLGSTAGSPSQTQICNPNFASCAASVSPRGGRGGPGWQASALHRRKLKFLEGLTQPGHPLGGIETSAGWMGQPVCPFHEHELSLDVGRQAAPVSRSSTTTCRRDLLLSRFFQGCCTGPPGCRSAGGRSLYPCMPRGLKTLRLLGGTRRRLCVVGRA